MRSALAFVRPAAAAALLVAIAACRSAAAPASPPTRTFEAWLASEDKTFARDIPRFGSGRCGDVVLSADAARAYDDVVATTGWTTDSRAGYAARWGLSLEDAQAIYTGFYASLFPDAFSFDAYAGKTLVWRGVFRHPDGHRTVQVYWRNGVFLREGTSLPQSEDDFVPAKVDPRVPASLEAVLVARGDRAEVWYGGRGHVLLATESVVPRSAQTGQAHVISRAPCTFVDRAGHSFAGTRRMDRVFDATPMPPPAREVVIVRIEVNGGQEGLGTDWVATKVEEAELDAARLAKDARAALEEAAREHAGEIDAKTASIRAPESEACASGPSQTPLPPPATQMTSVDETIARYAWLPATRTFRVALIHRRGTRWIATRKVVHTYSCPPGAPCMPPSEECIPRAGGDVWELTGHFEYDGTGARVRAEIWPLRHVTE